MFFLVYRTPNRRVLAGAMGWLPYDMRRTAVALPAIHDSTTDLADPPQAGS